MIVIGPAQDILDESYLVSIESRGYIQEPGESPIKPASLPIPPPPTPSQLSVPSTPLRKSPIPSSNPVAGSNSVVGTSPGILPDLIPTGHRERVDRYTPAIHPVDPHPGRETVIVEMHPQGVTIRDLVHPSLTEPLKNHQQTSFKIVKLVSDFNHKLSMVHEQFAEDTAQLVEAFRKRTSDILSEGPRCNSSLALSWDQWMTDVMQDSGCHTEIASVLGRAVARTLLEKTFHMKIQSRKVFAQRENYEGLLANTEDNLTKMHNDYRQSWSRHVEQPTQESLALYLEKHNSYVQQIHCTNSMIDHYFVECLPHLQQELDDVYQDVSAVVVDSLTEGAKTIAQKTTGMATRWEKASEVIQKINPEQDLNQFIQSLHLPDFVPITRHSFLPVPSKDANNDQGLPIRTCEVVLDRAVSESARIKYENVRAESKDIEGSIKLGNDALENLVRIQAKNLDQQLYNKANEIQEEISRKRIELRLSQLQLAGVRAQKELFSSKVSSDAESKGQVDGVPSAGPRERKLSNSSTGTNIKSKWVKAFKTIKGKDEIKSKGPGNGAVQIIENSHIFQEYTYKKITPCDVCSQILRGHSRQGLKCKMCRMNVHPDCQDKVVKCQPKSKLLRRQKSASEFDSRGDEPESGGNTRFGSPTGAGREPASPNLVMMDVTSGGGKSTPTSPALLGGVAAIGVPGGGGMITDDMAATALQQRQRRRMGGSYSTYTGPSPNNGYGIASGLGMAIGFSLNNDGDLLDSSGRRIKTDAYTTSVLEGGVGAVVGISPHSQQPRHA